MAIAWWAPDDVLAEDHELVAAEARRGVAGAQHVLEPPRDVDEQLVAGPVAERVVDDLEAVEVAEQHGQRAGVAAQRGSAPARGGRGTAPRLGSPVSASCSAWWASSTSTRLRSTA